MENDNSERKQKVKILFDYAYKLATIMKVILLFVF